MFMTKHAAIILLICLNTMLFSQAELVSSGTFPVDPSVRNGKLPNGLTYYIRANSLPPGRATLQLAMKIGSVQEEDDQQGYAHLTEHMAFRGSKHFPGSQLIDYLNTIGVGLHNGLGAATTIDMINYELQIPTDSLEAINNGILILRDWAQDIAFEEESLRAERDVVLEEMRSKLGFEERIRRKLLGVVYAGSRYADRLPLGKKSALEDVTSDKIRKFYHDWYRPDLQAVIAVGDFDPEYVERQIIRTFSDLATFPDVPEFVLHIVPDRTEPAAVIITDPEAPSTSLQLIWNMDRLVMKTIEGYRQNMVMGMIGYMAEQRLAEFLTQPDPPFIEVNSQGFVSIRGKANTSYKAQIRSDQAISALEALLTEVERIKRHGFVQTELDRAKQASLGKAEQALEQRDTQNSKLLAWKYFGSFCLDQPLMDNDQTFELTRQLCENISLEEVNARAGLAFPNNNLVIALIAPDSESQMLPDRDTLLRALTSVEGSEIAPYVETISSNNLIQNEIQPGWVVAEDHYPGSGMREWKLSNGVRVLSKSSSFTSGEVLIHALRHGGTDRYSRSSLAAARASADYVVDNGVGGMSPVLLSNKLAGENVSVTPYIESGEEGFMGNCSRKDLETAFQLVYLYATTPNINEKEFPDWLSRMRIRLQQGLMDPEQCLVDSVKSLLYDRHPRSQPMRVEDLSLLSLDGVEQVYRESFTDFKDFVFVVVGDFDEQELKTYCEKYLASLPAQGEGKRIRDTGMRLASGKKSLRMYQGMEDKSTVVMAVSGNCDYTWSTKTGLDMLTLLINQKLRKNIRDARSGAYLIQAEHEMIRSPKSHYRLFIAMQCEPSRVEELSGVISATLDSLRDGQIDDKSLKMISSTMQMKEELNQINNQWWLDRIVFATRGKHLEKQLQTQSAILEKPDLKRLRKTAKKYLTPRATWVSGFLDPINSQNNDSHN
jgi:zinc protease